ncbi:hypothetical protein NI18_03380 [Sphingomonas sp. Ant20]|nr:hypothetical protein NI18_03380 [Sphingomonas sp. Ant20]
MKCLFEALLVSLKRLQPAHQRARGVNIPFDAGYELCDPCAGVVKLMLRGGTVGISTRAS